MADTTGRFRLDASLFLRALRCSFARILILTAGLWASRPFLSQEFG